MMDSGIVARLAIDSKRRIYIPKSANFVGLTEADQILLTKDEQSPDSSFRLVLIRNDRIFRVWKMVPET